MSRSRQPARLYTVDLAVFIRPVQFPMPLDCVEHPQTVVQVDQIGAATHQHVLAVVDELTASGIDEAGRSSAENLSALDDDWLTVGLGELKGRGNSRQAAADDRDTSFQRQVLPTGLPGLPNHLARTAMTLLCQAPRRTRLFVTICEGSSSIFTSSEW